MILLSLRNSVSEWATEFGRELRELAEIMTKSKDLKQVSGEWIFID